MKRFLMFAAVLVLGGSIAVWAQATSSSATGTQSGNNSATSGTTATSPDQNQQSTGTAGSTSGATSSTGTASDNTQSGTAATATSSTSDQGNAAATSTGQTGRKKHRGNLPQTASPLPLLGMLGFGSMAAGALVRRFRK